MRSARDHLPPLQNLLSLGRTLFRFFDYVHGQSSMHELDNFGYTILRAS